MLKAVILFLILFFIFSSSAQCARKISITSDRNSLSLDQIMTVMASASGFTDGEKIYIKGAFYKEGSSNYFGYTRFNDSWVKNSSSVKAQREVTVGSWNNSADVKIDYEDAGFTGVGDYNFKLGFYYLTNSGNTSSVNWSENSLILKIDNEPSPIPKIEKTSSASFGVNEIEVSVSNTPTPRKNPTPTYVSAKKITESVKITNIQKEASSYAKIKSIDNAEKKEEDIQVLGTKDATVFPNLFLFSGVLLIIVAGFIFLKRELKERKII